MAGSTRPRTITAIGWLFIAVGVVGFVDQTWKLVEDSGGRPLSELGGKELADFTWATVSHALAVIGGAFLLRGSGWARWLLVAWMVFHVYVGWLHSLTMLVTHALIFAPMIYLLLRTQAKAYFRSA